MRKFNAVWLGRECVGGHCPWRNTCAKRRESARRSFFSSSHFRLSERTGKYHYYCVAYIPGMDMLKVKKALEGLR